MFLLSILIATSWIWVPLLLIYIFTRNSKNNTNVIDQQNAQRDALWHTYIASFNGVVKTDKEKRLIETLMIGKPASEYGTKVQKAEAHSVITKVEPDWPEQMLTDEPVMAEAVYTPPVKVSQPLDNTILLLYFGAFLLVASVGLFVAIGGLDGLIRTIIVAITAAVLYFGGLWLYETNKKLAQAGISFVGTGMIIAPLTGVAWYNLVSNQTNSGLIWSLTSVVCIALYAHAYSRIRNEFVSYLLIGSFVSAIESSVLTINLPAYGYTWGLILAALALMANSLLHGHSVEFNKASDASSKLLIPLSVLGSIALLPKFGSLQLSITLFLSAVYYAMLAFAQSEYRKEYSTAAQVSFISAVVSTVYSIQESLVAAGITLVIVAAVYAFIVLLSKRELIQNYSFIEMAAVSNVIGLILCLGAAWPFVAGLGVATVLATIVWQKLQDDDVLAVAGLLLSVLPFVAGQYGLRIDLGSWNQLMLCAASALLLGALVSLTAKVESHKQYYRTASILYILGSALVLVPAGALGFAAISSVAFAVMISFTLLRYLAQDSNWLISSGLVALVPLFYSLFVFGVSDVRFSAAVAAALLWNIGVSLATRQAIVRWVVVGCILIAPFAIGGGGLGIHWAEAGYAGGYLLAMAACIAGRAIARGKLLVSFKVPIAGYYTEASQAYVTGYTLAAIASILVSLQDTHSQLITTLILGVMAVAVIVVSRIERKGQLLSLLPVIMQGALFSGIRPDIDNATIIGATALISTMAAVAAYAIVMIIAPAKNVTAKLTEQVCVVTAYIGPGLALTQAHPNLMLPASLFIAGLLTFFYNRSEAQNVKEISLGVCIASIHWFLYLVGYTNIHVHTHLLAVFMLGFAYWRSLLKDTEAANGYIQALFFVVTIPLALQGIGGENGSTYGLLLIGEQVCFMIAGATFGQKFLLRWGLWTALAAILFQLRGLGWAFLSLLALIVIGVAVYRLQKHSPDDE